MQRAISAIIKSTFFSLMILVIGCVRAAPYLTDDQERKLSAIQLITSPTVESKGFSIIGEVESADCTGVEGTRLYGNEERSLDTLKRKAVALGADALTEVSCQSVPLINNCWAAKVCTAKAVMIK